MTPEPEIKEVKKDSRNRKVNYMMGRIRNLPQYFLSVSHLEETRKERLYGIIIRYLSIMILNYLASFKEKPTNTVY